MKYIITLALIFIFTSFTPQQPEREYIIKIPYHLGQPMYLISIGKYGDLTVNQANELSPLIVSQLIQQGEKFRLEDSTKAAKDSSLKRKP